jgi:hypothetical protein
MKADEAPIALSGEEAASSPGCAFFFWGLEIVTRILKKLGFWLGSELAMLSKCTGWTCSSKTHFHLP